MQRLRCMALVVLSALMPARAATQEPTPGRAVYESRCTSCHGEDGNGGEFAGDIVGRIAALDDASLEGIVLDGIPARGMPAFELTRGEVVQLVTYLRTLRRPRGRFERLTIQTTTGERLSGDVVNQSFEDLQLRTPDGRIRLFRREGERFRPVTSDVDWPTYDGTYRGYRFTELDQIDRTNITRLAPRWVFTFASSSPLETTPVVVDGVMYVTSGNQIYALDAGSGRELWHYSRPLTRGLVGNAVNGINRGVAVDDRRVFFATDHAHLLALDRFTGNLLWETVMADWHENYASTAAPLLAGGLVVAGTGGGDAGARGFLAAYDPEDGHEVWRFWTVPSPGEPGSETWIGPGIERPGAVTWLSGSYDPELELIYWTTGNPGPDLNGDVRLGDNLYSDAVLALDVRTGELQWYYQFTPHDTWDYDAQSPLALIDTEWQGRPRKLLVQANRNGFFYVLDRTDGELLLAKAFARLLTWASGIDADGRPIRNPDAEPTDEGARACPSLIGATNWWSTAWHPGTGLYYVQTLESCGIFTKREDEWEFGRVYMGGGTRTDPVSAPRKILRAFDIRTAEAVWERPQIGTGSTRSGVLATASGIVFFGEDSGALMAVDARTGENLWHFQTSQTLRASPMSYSFDGRQHVVLAAGPSVIAFALPPDER